MGHLRKDILAQVHDDASMHLMFQQLRWHEIDFDEVIDIADRLHDKYCVTDLDVEEEVEIKEDSLVEFEQAEESVSASMCDGELEMSTMDGSLSVEPLEVGQEQELETEGVDNDVSVSSVMVRTREKSPFIVFDIRSVPDNLSRNIDDFFSIFDRKKWRWGKSG